MFVNISGFCDRSCPGPKRGSPDEGNTTELTAPQCATLTVYRVSLIFLLVVWFFVVAILIPRGPHVTRHSLCAASSSRSSPAST